MVCGVFGLMDFIFFFRVGLVFVWWEFFCVFVNMILSLLFVMFMWLLCIRIWFSKCLFVCFKVWVFNDLFWFMRVM